MAGEPVTIRALEPGEDNTDAVDSLLDLVRCAPVVAVDTETTGLDPHAPDFRVRLVQVSDGHTAYVLRADVHRDLIGLAIGTAARLAVHSAEFDLPALAVAFPGIFRRDELFARTTDVMVLSRLVDPLGDAVRRDGKLIPRHGLKELARKHLDPDLDTDRALTARLRHLGLPPKSKGGFAAIPTDDPTFVLYAGLDAVCTARLHALFASQLTAELAELAAYEARVAELLCAMRERGLLVDEPYTRQAIDQLRVQWHEAFVVVAEHGLPDTDLNTTEQRDRFAAVLRGLGVELPKTRTGLDALNKPVLAERVRDNPPAERLMAAFYRCRELAKQATDYCGKFLTAADNRGRLHPAIHALGAQTGRMSISDPPLQQIPRSGPIRGCLTADAGHVLVAADYAQIEFRVAAALAQDERMIANIRAGVDLHAVTARRLFGDGFSDDHRTVAKRAGFGRLYGAGPKAVARQCGTDLRTATRAVAAFDREYPGIIAFARATTRQDTIVTRLGRRLPLDRQRSFIGVNYAVQSEARDVFAQALLRLADAGLAEHLWLPIHDEVIVNVPAADAEDAARVMTAVMADELDGVPIVADAHVLGKRWTQ